MPANPNRQYNYDAVGNRTSSVTDGATTSYAAANTNTYTAVGGVSWTTDINGNVTNDGSRTFTWEVHDRLVQVQQGGAVTGTYRYDALGRRISQTVGNGSAARTTRFLYNLWNVVGEFETAAGSPAGAVAVMRRNIWGHDLSGTPQGAGGVGGLLMIEDRSSGTPVAHYVCQDGNGNVIRLLTAGSGGGVITSAVYAYDPFGKVRTAFGTFAATNRWRFSTKLEDAETGLNYYGYRYYDPVAGRWLSRDPIEERGGFNLYAMVGNNPAGTTDAFGLIGAGSIPTTQNGVPGMMNGWTGQFTPYSTPMPPDTSDGLSYPESAGHYYSGTGTTVTVPFDVIDKGLRAEDFGMCDFEEGVHSITRLTTMDLWRPRTSTFFTTGGPGRINFRLKGTLTVMKRIRPGTCCERYWSFSGSISADPDKFDFDPQGPWYAPWRSGRGGINELITRTQYYLGPNGRSYTINFDGSRSVNESGTCMGCK